MEIWMSVLGPMRMREREREKERERERRECGRGKRK